MRITALAAAAGGMAVLLATAYGRLQASGVGADAVILFERRSKEGIAIARQDLLRRETRVVYFSLSEGGLPGDFGFMPSPDGEWVLVWDWLAFHYQNEEPGWRESGPDKTRWVLVRVADGEVRKLGESSGAPSLLPYWRDARHLILEGADESASFDVAARTHEWPFGGDAGARAWEQICDEEMPAHVVYARKYLKKETAALFKALKRLRKELRLERYYERDYAREEEREYLLLRSLGLPNPRGALIDEHIRLPVVAPSPDGKMIVYSYLGETMHLRTPSPDAPEAEAWLATSRLSVYDLASKKLKWSLELRPRAHRVPKWTHPVQPDPLPFVTPTFEDVRWSTTGRYLSFTVYNVGGPKVTVMDSATWREVASIPGAVNAFVIESAAR